MSLEEEVKYSMELFEKYIPDFDKSKFYALLDKYKSTPGLAAKLVGNINSDILATDFFKLQNPDLSGVGDYKKSTEETIECFMDDDFKEIAKAYANHESVLDKVIMETKGAFKEEKPKLMEFFLKFKTHPEVAKKIAETRWRLVQEGGSELVVQYLDSMLGFDPKEAGLMSGFLDGIAHVTKDPDIIKNCIYFAGEYARMPEVAKEVFFALTVLANKKKNDQFEYLMRTYLSEDFKKFLYQFKPEAANVIVREVAELTELRDAHPHYRDLKLGPFGRFIPEKFMDSLNYFKSVMSTLGSKFEPFVYEEFSDYLHKTGGSRREFESMLKKEKSFFRRQGSDAVFPLAIIMHKIDKKYHSQVKELSEYAKQCLAKAYSIADKNYDEKDRNYLDRFYEGLNSILENHPGKIGAWAESIINDFKKKKDDALLRFLNKK